jgi:hypothetical protein
MFNRQTRELYKSLKDTCKDEEVRPLTFPTVAFLRQVVAYIDHTMELVLTLNRLNS